MQKLTGFFCTEAPGSPRPQATDFFFSFFDNVLLSVFTYQYMFFQIKKLIKLQKVIM